MWANLQAVSSFGEYLLNELRVFYPLACIYLRHLILEARSELSKNQKRPVQFCAWKGLNWSWDSWNLLPLLRIQRGSECKGKSSVVKHWMFTSSRKTCCSFKIAPDCPFRNYDSSFSRVFLHQTVLISGILEDNLFSLERFILSAVEGFAILA